MAKYSSAGVQQWVRLVGNSGSDGITGIDLSPTGRVVLSGLTTGSIGAASHNGGSHDAFAAAYTTSGKEKWTKLVGRSGLDAGYDIAGGAPEVVFLGGVTDQNLEGETYGGGPSDGFVVRMK